MGKQGISVMSALERGQIRRRLGQNDSRESRSLRADDELLVLRCECVLFSPGTSNSWPGWSCDSLKTGEQVRLGHKFIHPDEPSEMEVIAWAAQ